MITQVYYVCLQIHVSCLTTTTTQPIWAACLRTPLPPSWSSGSQCLFFFFFLLLVFQDNCHAVQNTSWCKALTGVCTCVCVDERCSNCPATWTSWVQSTGRWLCVWPSSGSSATSVSGRGSSPPERWAKEKHKQHTAWCLHWPPATCLGTVFFSFYYSSIWNKWIISSLQDSWVVARIETQHKSSFFLRPANEFKRLGAAVIFFFCVTTTIRQQV